MPKSTVKWYLIFFVLTFVANADDDSILCDVPKLFNLQECIKNSTNDCIAAACIENAPADCPTQCRGIAENKCRDVSQQKILRMQ